MGGAVTSVRAALVTHHHKGETIGPVLASWGWVLETIDADTDRLGTFSGDVARPADPVETARRKARLGRDRTDAPWFVASEGAVSAGLLGLARDVEWVVAVPRDGEGVVVGVAQSLDVAAFSLEVGPGTPDHEIAERVSAGLEGGHHLIALRHDHREPSRGALASVEDVVRACAGLGVESARRVQTDYRAHLCPSRRPVIAAAAADLAVRWATPCPHCGRGGFGPGGPLSGRPCASCGTPTAEPLGRWWVCPWCARREARVDNPSPVSAAACPVCNP